MAGRRSPLPPAVQVVRLFALHQALAAVRLTADAAGTASPPQCPQPDISTSASAVLAIVFLPPDRGRGAIEPVLQHGPLTGTKRIVVGTHAGFLASDRELPHL